MWSILGFYLHFENFNKLLQIGIIPHCFLTHTSIEFFHKHEDIVAICASHAPEGRLLVGGKQMALRGGE